jgi:hypothetical protein
VSSYSRASVAMDGDIILIRRSSSSNDLSSEVQNNTMTSFKVNNQMSPQTVRSLSPGVS